MLARVFDAGADEVLLDLEDGVGPSFKEQARLGWRTSCVSPPGSASTRRGARSPSTTWRVIGGLATGIRVPKVEGPEDVAWVRERLAGRDVPITASIESAVGVLNAAAIAASPGVASLTFGNVDFGADIGVHPGDLDATAHARSVLGLASRAAGISPPSDGDFTRFDDDDGLRRACGAARRLGFAGKSAIHPRQVAIINEAFSPTDAEIQWARPVVPAFEKAQGAATSAGAEMIDVRSTSGPCGS